VTATALVAAVGDRSSFKNGRQFAACLADATHVQSFEVRRASGPTASSGADGDLIVAGHTGRIVETAAGVKAFAGLGPDLFAGDAIALGEFRTALFEKEQFDPGAFQSRKNFFARSKRLRGARGAHSPHRTRCRAWLGDSIALRPRARDPKNISSAR
jgi:hypothetical protein